MVAKEMKRWEECSEVGTKDSDNWLREEMGVVIKSRMLSAQVISYL